jgi:hypothetical protein
MSHHNYTQLVTPNTCIGDSLATFNSNFSALDDALYKQPTIVSGKGISTNQHITEQNAFLTQVNTNNSFIYNTRFDSLANGAVVASPTLDDGSAINSVSFPYVAPALGALNPTATFSVVSPTNVPPKVTIYWTAAGSEDRLTVYSTNRTTTLSTDMGYEGGFNGSVKSMMLMGNQLYVGGEFTSVGGVPLKKFCILDIDGGTSDGSVVGSVGSIVGIPSLYDSYSLSSFNSFGDTGSINAMAAYGDLIVFGGSYQSLKNNAGVLNRALGRGLTIWDRANGYIFPFYVNGEVNTVDIQGIYLFIGGTFDYINYGSQSASVVSGARVYTNGLARINLSQIQTAPNKSISTLFCNNVLDSFERNATINIIKVKPYDEQSNTCIYIGGKFVARRGTRLTGANLAILNSSGTTSRTWLPVVDGEVNALNISGNYLYVGGKFNSFTTVSNYEANPRQVEEYHNVIGFEIKTDSLNPVVEPKWRPKVNGSVNGFWFHETGLSEYVYCYGNFTNINDVDVQYIGAIPKCLNGSDNIGLGQTPINWKVYLDSPPSLANQSLLRYGASSVILGGNFTKVNGSTRNHLTRISGPFEEANVNITSSTAYLAWTLGAQTCVPGTNLTLAMSKYTSVTSTPMEFGQLNQTTFSSEYTREIFKNCSEGTLMRFSVQRQSAPSDTLINLNAYVVGWKLDFN